MAGVGIVRSVDWSRLKDAHGFAGDLPALIGPLGHQTRPSFEETLGHVSWRCGSSGAIFPATSHAGRELIPILGSASSPEKSCLYEVLAAVTESAREAALSSPERPCAAGSQADGLAVLRNI